MESDTVRLLRECDAGVTMGTEAIDRILRYVRSPLMRQSLRQCRHRHMHLQQEIRIQLQKEKCSGKKPHPLASAMAGMRIRWSMRLHRSDRMAADLITQGTNMGIQSLSHYLNRYAAAEESARQLTRRLIDSEQELVEEIRPYL